MAEALIAVGLAAAIVQFVDFTAKLLVRIHGLHQRAEESSQTIDELRVRLPLLRLTLEQTHSQVKNTSLHAEAQSTILEAVKGCYLQVCLLDKLLPEQISEQAFAGIRRPIRAISRSNRERRLRVVVDRIREYQISLVHYQTTYLTILGSANNSSQASQGHEPKSHALEACQGRIVHVHILSGDSSPERHLYLPVNTHLKDLLRQLSEDTTLTLRNENDRVLPLQSCSEAITITDQESNDKKRVLNVHEPFAVFLSKSFPQPDIITSLEKGDGEEGSCGQAVLVNGDLEISFHRTLRLSNHGQTYSMPPPLAPYPLYNAGQLGGRLALDMREKGGVIFPMWQREAVRVQFKHRQYRSLRSYAVRPFVGGVNCISGEAARPGMSHMLRELNGVARKQDYLVVGGGASSVQHLDGIAVAPGIVRQLVALPIQSPESIEWQMTGLNSVGGLQLEIVPQFGRSIPTLYREDTMKHRIRKFEGSLLATAKDLGMSPGTQVYYKVNSMRSRTLLDEMSCRDGQERNYLTFRIGKEPFITLSVRNGDDETLFKIGMHTKLSKMMVQYTEMKGICYGEYRFLFDNCQVRGDDTPDLLEMGSFETVQVHKEQVGGCYSRFDIVWDLSDHEAPAIGFGAGAQILQNIRSDEQDPRSWDVCAAKLLNIQILNSKVFEQVFGIPRPLTPITFAAYSRANIPIFQRYLETPSSVHGNFNRILSLEEAEEAEESDRRIARPQSSCIGRPKIPDSLFLGDLDRPKSWNGFPCNVSLQDVDAEWKSFESVLDLASLKIGS